MDWEVKGFDFDGLCFEGGGMKGIAYAGVIKALEEKSLLKKFKIISGSSIGAAMALLVVLEYDSDFIINWILKEDFCKSLLEANTEKRLLDSFFPFNIGKAFINCIREFGNNCTDHIEDILKTIVSNGFNQIHKRKYGILLGSEKATGDETFRDLYELNGKVFLCTGTNYNTQSLKYFSYYDTPDMPLWIAVAISTCMPFHFKPIEYEGSLWGDGGIINNLPIVATQRYCKKVFTVCGVFKGLVKEDNMKIGLSREDVLSQPEEHVPINNIYDFIFKLLRCSSKSEATTFVPIELTNQVIKIQYDGDITSLSTDIPEKLKQKYINRGHRVMLSFLVK